MWGLQDPRGQEGEKGGKLCYIIYRCQVEVTKKKGEMDKKENKVKGKKEG